MVETLGEVMVEISESTEGKYMTSLSQLDTTIAREEKCITNYQASVIHLRTMRVALELEAKKVKLKIREKIK